MFIYLFVYLFIYLYSLETSTKTMYAALCIKRKCPLKCFYCPPIELQKKAFSANWLLAFHNPVETRNAFLSLEAWAGKQHLEEFPVSK